jgi:hypothetical protein
MSRFFRPAGDSSESESSSSSESELMSSDDEAPPKPAAPGPKRAMDRFLRGAGSGSDSSSDDDSDEDSDDDDQEDDEGEEDRPAARILSAQEKRLKEMEATSKVMDNGLKINDWVAISNGKALPFDIRPLLMGAKNSTSSDAWFRGSKTSLSPLRQFSSRRLPALNRPSTPPWPTKRRRKRR